MKTILIVDDDQQFVSGMVELLRLNGHDVTSAGDLASARLALGKRIPQLLLIDLMLPDGSGLELLDELGDSYPERVALITGHTAIKSFVHSIAGPGMQYLTKPVEIREVLGIIDSLEDAEDAHAVKRHFGSLIGESQPMQAIYQQIKQVAPGDSTVFIQGESGTGKELVAAAIHQQSGRKGAFIPVNCGGLSAELVASELFGHEKGSFTGAGRQHAGYFERASGGTLFLDEVTEMPVEMQTQLLRVLETGRFTRVGGEKELECDTRLVAATNREPTDAVKDGHLRKDLYFRLQVFPITLPPLSSRLHDIGPLALFFLGELNQRNATQKSFANDFIETMSKHSWPGNVRELKHLVHRSYILSPDEIVRAPETFDEPLSSDGALSVGKSIRDVEKQLIVTTLAHYNGDKKAAAATLGVSLKTLYNRLKDYDVDV